MTRRTRSTTLALLAAFTLCGPGRAGAQFSLGGLAATAKIAATKKAVGSVINTELPIRLDATNLYPTIDTLPGGAFNIRLKDGKDTDLTVARDRAREFKERAGG